ncbi:alpha/beta hydrolase [Paractinoplanes deccanensis]|uniref:Alpha/beta hydrolase n=1 Tax=Paractinoplanes deccanensis TaxID=113561 RepID=A0ABQ3Y186_9ACTN|nr:alpha/beta hydrolase [Actinoplanes deccanensis]GID73763.1 alpha/beta hydrolase [Actinoplanes deccanensis]
MVLVHGAWADASGWNAVTAKLQAQGYPVIAPANPLRGVAEDSDYLRSFLATISGPIVLVGHSYGGAVITNAATGNKNVKSLVYVSAYAPDQGETIAEAGALAGGDNSVLVSHLVKRPYPNAGGYVDTTVDPAWFPKLFAADAPLSQTRLMATQQRPLSTAAFEGETGVPAWKTIPAWYLVSLNDQTIPPVAEKAMAARAAKGRTVMIHSSHAAMVAHPDAVTDLILRAAR